MRATLSQMVSMASELGIRQASPSAIAVMDGASVTLRDLKLSAYDGDFSATTPTMVVFSPSALRAAATPEMDEPKLQGVCCCAHYQALMERVDHGEGALLRQRAGIFERLLKVVPMLYQFHALREHGAILLFAVAKGNDDHSLDTCQSRCHAHALAVVAARGCHHARHPRMRLLQPIHVDQRAAQLECAHRSMVLMLDPSLGAETVVDQRP